MVIGKVKEVMDGQGISIRDVAKATGLSTCTIHRARGDMIGRCTLDTLTSIAGALGVKVKDLFEEG